MTDEEYSMPFGTWVTAVKGEDVRLDQFGELDWREPRKRAVVEKWHDLWDVERKNYVLIKKGQQIQNALEAIKAAGYKCRLMNYDNAHIIAISKHGKKISYYATTGTITGYAYTEINGIDAMIGLLGRI